MVLGDFKFKMTTTKNPNNRGPAITIIEVVQ